MRTILLFAAALFAESSLSAALQTVPEGVHSRADGPETICGVTGTTAQDFERQVRASPAAKYNNETDRYLTYEGPMQMTLWAFAKPTNTAHPLSTCLQIFEKDGATYAERKMHCDATRAQCDKAFLEFVELDRRNRRMLQGN